MRIVRSIPVILFAASLFLATIAQGDEPIQLVRDPAISPDGKRLAFTWNDDIWITSIQGGVARRITNGTSRESQPMFSPDGKRLALISDRSGANQLHVVDVRGGMPEQWTFHSEGCSLEQWTDESILLRASRDHYWRRSERFITVAPGPRPKENVVFNAYGSHGRISPDGTKMLFQREGVRGYRKGYRGSQAAQIWLYDMKSEEFSQICHPETGARYPLWHPNGKEFFYVGGQSGAFELWKRNLESGDETQLTEFSDDDSVLMPAVSGDGKTLVFRRKFDLYRLKLNAEGVVGKPQRIRLTYRGDALHRAAQHRTLESASEAAFTPDGLEIAFIAGGDLWVMDTVLKEPKQVTSTPEEESSPVFAPDGKSIWFTSDTGGTSDIWKATRTDEKSYWWQNDQFKLEQVTQDSELERELRWSPTGEHLAFLKSRGDLWLLDKDGKNPKRILESWSSPDFDWSPDGKWLVYAISDNDFNRDVFILPIDGSRPAYNVSRHPDNDSNPVWSPDGKMIAFTGRRVGTETDIYYVMLAKAENEVSSRDRTLEKAIEKIQKVRKKPPQRPAGSPMTSAKEQAPETAKEQGDKPKEKGEAKPAGEEEKSAAPAKPKTPPVKIDFEGLAERVRRVTIPDAREGGLFWSPDSKKLAFTASINGKSGLHTISPPESLEPKLLSSTTGSNARWLATGNQIVWLVGGKPASLTATGQAAIYAFRAQQTIDVANRNQVIFDLCWRAMRDNWYDDALNNRNWNAIRRKYVEAAMNAPDLSTLSTVINMMLGELNGSHLGFSARSPSQPDPGFQWRDSTAHLGVRFDHAFQGPGLKVKDVIRNGPSWREKSRLHAGDVILAIDGVEVDPDMELTKVLNGDLSRDIQLQVKNAKDETRDVTIRPTSYSAVRGLLYEQWIHDNQQEVSKASKGKFGYVHIQGMNMTSFYRFERELYAVASGKDGLIIDVRENGGGSTTDHLLTILTQPTHAITVPRGGGRGYPHDRRIYATWSKPIVVLCNQNSFSNAEIFSHSIKTLERGKVVGVTTAGGVISTGGARISDIGFLRMPFRGWFLMDGKDMEMNGCVPHHELWPHPAEMPQGTDRQLEKALEVLAEDVKAWNARPQPKLIRASELRKDS